LIGSNVVLKNHELSEWGISRRVATAFIILPFVGAVSVALTRFWYPLFRALTAEDHIIEWAQFICWVVSCAASGVVANRLWRSHRRGLALLWASLSLGFFLIAGEEIAWGQRLLGLETPEALERVNRQQEITVHNIGLLGYAFDVVFIAAGLYGAGAALWCRHLRPRQNTDLVDLLVPPLFLAGLFSMVPLYKLIRLPLALIGVPSFIDYAEYIELCLALGVACFSVLLLRRRRSGLTSPRKEKAASLSPSDARY
jgi:hypothetical protein